MKQLSSIKLFFVAILLTPLVACTSTTILPAPEQSELIAVQFTEDGLSALFDLPTGVYRVPGSQVIISGHQSGSWVGSVLGPFGLALQSAIDAESGQEAVQQSSDLLQISLTAAANDIAQTLISRREYAQTFTDVAAPDSPILQVKTAVVLTYQDDEALKPFVILQAALKHARTNTTMWESRYIASSGPARPFTGDTGWTVNEGTVFEDTIALNLEKAITTMLTDIAAPYTRTSKALITVQGHYPYIREKVQTVGYALLENDTDIIFQPKLGNAVVFSGVQIMDKSTIEMRPAMPDDDIYKVIEEKEAASVN